MTAFLAMLLAAGCGGLPDSGPVRVGPPVPRVAGWDEPDIRVLPPAPTPGQSPEQVVRAFLVASASFESRHAVARRYLAPEQRERWDSEAGVAVYDAVGLSVTTQRQAVVVSAPWLATLGREGGYAPAAPGARLRELFRVRRVDGQWRITNIPAGLRLSRADVSRAYRRVTLYFLDPSGQVLVPEQVYLPVRLSVLSTALVRALLRGPTPWLAPAVRTAVPRGTTLLTTAPVNDGVVTVDLSREAAAPGTDLAGLSAQLVWTLRQIPEVRGVRLLVEGARLTVPGAGSVQSRHDWQAYDPAALPAGGVAYVVRGGRLLKRDGAPVEGPLGDGRMRLDDPALAPGRPLVAGLRRDANGGAALYAGPLTPGPVRRRVAPGFTPPSWDGLGRLWTVERGRGALVLADGVRPLHIVAPALAEMDVRALRVSRDGTRLAVVVATPRGNVLLIARVTRLGGRLSVDGLRPAAPDLVGIRDLAWAGNGQLVVLAGTAAGTTQASTPWAVEADGSATLPLPTPMTTLDRIAAAPDRPVLAGGGGRVWELDGGLWRAIAPGFEPVYSGG